MAFFVNQCICNPTTYSKSEEPKVGVPMHNPTYLSAAWSGLPTYVLIKCKLTILYFLSEQNDTTKKNYRCQIHAWVGNTVRTRLYHLLHYTGIYYNVHNWMGNPLQYYIWYSRLVFQAGKVAVKVLRILWVHNV